jgi:XTP/dITP diphosphohydrolase
MNLVFATNNQHKFIEIRKILNADISLLSLNDIHCVDELPETQHTLEGNAQQKASYVYDNFGYNCFADDTGLEIEALNGRPGVYSARYAGQSKDPAENMDKVIRELRNISNRRARFRTVIALIINEKNHLFEGIVNGQILSEKRGTQGFGYDPIFLPDGYEVSFAQMNLDEKNKISHRGKAVAELVTYLNNYHSK